jgi:hypothetical protein
VGEEEAHCWWVQGVAAEEGHCWWAQEVVGVAALRSLVGEEAEVVLQKMRLVWGP